MSSTFSVDHTASRCIDDNLATLCATTETSPGVNWVAVQVPPGTRVSHVAVYNRQDYASIQHWLGSIQVWLGTAPGATGGTATLCGVGSYDATISQAEPYVFSCAGATSGSFVTVLNVGCTTCILALAEVAVYQLPLLPPAPLPAHPPPPSPPPFQCQFWCVPPFTCGTGCRGCQGCATQVPRPSRRGSEAMADDQRPAQRAEAVEASEVSASFPAAHHPPSTPLVTQTALPLQGDSSTDAVPSVGILIALLVGIVLVLTLLAIACCKRCARGGGTDKTDTHTKRSKTVIMVEGARIWQEAHVNTEPHLEMTSGPAQSFPMVAGSESIAKHKASTCDHHEG